MDEFLDNMRLETDPVADAVVTRIIKENGPEEAKKLFTLLIRNVDIPFDHVPDYVKAYMQENAALPEDFDLERIKRGQQVFINYGPYFCGFLFFKSLPTCYLDWKGAQVLFLTGRLDESRGYPEIYARRIAETLQFVLDCMTPGAMDPAGKARQTILKVRLIHASIRHFIRRRPEWKMDEWDQPINQEDMALTLQSFGTTMIEGMEQLGTPLSEQEAGDFHYAWQAVGHILGVREDLNPSDVEEGKKLLRKILDRNAGDSEAGRSLTGALIAFGEELIPSKTLDWTVRTLVAFYLGEKHAAMAGVKAHGCLVKFLPQVIAKAIGVENNLEGKSKGMKNITDIAGLALIRALQKRMNNYKGRPFQIPEQMQAAWGT